MSILAQVEEEEDDTEKTAAEMITPATDEAIQSGLVWLASRQADDGSFGSGAYRGNVAITGLAGMAMMASGSTPGRGPYGAEVNRCLDFILENTEQSGFITSRGSASHGPMYGHGFATLFLAESYGMSKRPALRDALARAVRLIVNTQNRDGGWRYQPRREDADLSVTICQVMALRAAKNVGIHVPNETIDRCIEYVKKSQNPDGGYHYMVQGGDSRFALTAAGVVALYSAGVYEGPEIAKGLKYLIDRGEADQESYFYYGHYYAVQAMWHAGGEEWKGWYPAVRDNLLARQHKEGAWPATVACPEYSTAMACIILQMPDNGLPIFQR